MSEQIITLAGVVVGGLIGWAGSYFLYSKQRAHDLQALAASLATEVEHLLEGLGTYLETLEGARSAAFHLNTAVPVVEPPFSEADFRVYLATVGLIGRLPRKVGRAIIGFYQFLEMMPDRVAEINRAVAKTLHQGRLAVELTQSFITKTDEALEGGKALHGRLDTLSK